MRVAHEPVAAPLLLPVPPLPPLPVPLLPAPLLPVPPLPPAAVPPSVQGPSHIAVSHWKTGPSQSAQLMVMQVVSCDVHMASRQSTQTLEYPPKTSPEGHAQPLVSMLGEPLEDASSLPVVSSPPEPPPLDPDGPPEPEPLEPLDAPLWSPVPPLPGLAPFEPPHATANASARATIEDER
jgi:hypothetical protein